MWTRRFLLNSSSWFYDDIIFQDAKLNEVDSGTELDSQAEDEVEEIGSVENVEKDETEKKEDWFWFIFHKPASSLLYKRFFLINCILTNDVTCFHLSTVSDHIIIVK